MHAYQNNNEQNKANNNIKKNKQINKQNKQERPLTLKLTGIVEKPRENSYVYFQFTTH